MVRPRFPSAAPVVAFALLVALASPAPVQAEEELPAVSLAPDRRASIVSPTIPVIPVRENEVWFREAWDMRLIVGYASDNNFGEIVGGGFDVDTDSQSLIGFDFGRPLVDNWRDWPVDFAWRIGVQRYMDSGSGASGFAQTAYLKMYWRPFPWEKLVSTRIGFGEGLSYAWRVPEVERQYARDHDEDTSRLLNYLDVSLDVNVGDIIRNERARSCTLGLVISHRSGVFGLIDIFGNVRNGSNYNTAAVECGF